MISPIIAAQSSGPIANVQQNAEAQGMLHNQIAHKKAGKRNQQDNQENERTIRESVVKKDEAVFYTPRHDAKEEGRNKYQNLYDKKRKKGDKSEEESDTQPQRVNFDMKI